MSALLPILFGAEIWGQSQGWPATMPDIYQLARSVAYINLGLLVFNILPIYPLDGGQILRSALWFVLGRARSFMAATVIGFVGVAGFIGLALWRQDLWLGAIAVFMLMSCWGGLKHAMALSRFAKLPRRHGFACPACKTSPPVGEFWRCGKMRPAIRHICNPGDLPPMRHSIPRDQVPGLRRSASHE